MQQRRKKTRTVVTTTIESTQYHQFQSRHLDRPALRPPACIHLTRQARPGLAWPGLTRPPTRLSATIAIDESLLVFFNQLTCTMHQEKKSSTPSVFFRTALFRNSRAPYVTIAISTTTAIAVTIAQVGVPVSPSSRPSTVPLPEEESVSLGAPVGLKPAKRASHSKFVSGKPQLHRTSSRSVF